MKKLILLAVMAIASMSAFAGTYKVEGSVTYNGDNYGSHIIIDKTFNQNCNVAHIYMGCYVEYGTAYGVYAKLQLEGSNNIFPLSTIIGEDILKTVRSNSNIQFTIKGNVSFDELRAQVGTEIRQYCHVYYY